MTLGGSSGAAIAAKEAELGLAKGALKEAIHVAQHGAFRDAQHASDTAELLKKSGLDATAGLARAHQQIQKLTAKGLMDSKFGARQASNLHGLQALSQAEVDTL